MPLIIAMLFVWIWGFSYSCGTIPFRCPHPRFVFWMPQRSRRLFVVKDLIRGTKPVPSALSHHSHGTVSRLGETLTSEASRSELLSSSYKLIGLTLIFVAYDFALPFFWLLGWLIAMLPFNWCFEINLYSKCSVMENVLEYSTIFWHAGYFWSCISLSDCCHLCPNCYFVQQIICILFGRSPCLIWKTCLYLQSAYLIIYFNNKPAQSCEESSSAVMLL